MQRSHKQLLLAALVAAYTAIVPVLRAGMHLEVGYNEGWNLYNARTVLAHQPLYAEAYGWHTVNYPALSFYLSAWLSHLTGDLLYTGRALSLLGLLASALLLAAMVQHLTASRFAAVFTALLTISVMCASAPSYIGQYDPQIFATPFFLAALYLYLRHRERNAALILVALLFVLAGNLKHNLIDIPLAVTLDLLLSDGCRRLKRLTLFLGAAIPATVLSLWLNQHFAGPAFLSNLLAGRGYSLRHAFDNAIGTIGPLIPPFAAACFTAWQLRHDAQKRIASLWLACALVLNLFFAGGVGVAANALFNTLLATVLLLGLFLSLPSRVGGIITTALALWPLLPLFITNETSLPLRDLRRLHQQQATYEQALTLLQQTPGPALCESLLLCAEANKPYLYDPFNATRFIQLGKLDPAPLYTQLQQQHFTTIQLNKSIDLTQADTDANRFTPQLLDILRARYTPAFDQPGMLLLHPRT